MNNDVALNLPSAQRSEDSLSEDSSIEGNDEYASSKSPSLKFGRSFKMGRTG